MQTALIPPIPSSAASFVSRLLATTALTTAITAALWASPAGAQVVIGGQPPISPEVYEQRPAALPQKGEWPYIVKPTVRERAAKQVAVDPATLSSRQVSPQLMQAARLMQSGLTPDQVHEAMAQSAPALAAPELQGEKPDAPRDSESTLPVVATGPLMASLADGGAEPAAAAAPLQVADSQPHILQAPAAPEAGVDTSIQPSSFSTLGDAPAATTATETPTTMPEPAAAPASPTGSGRALFGGKQSADRIQVADATPMPDRSADSSAQVLKMPDTASDMPSPQAAPATDVAATPTPPVDMPANTVHNSTPAKIAPLTSLSAPPKLLARIGDSSRGTVERPAATAASETPPPEPEPVPVADSQPPSEPVPQPEPEPEPERSPPPAAVLPAKVDEPAPVAPVIAPMGGGDTPPTPDAAVETPQQSAAVSAATPVTPTVVKLAPQAHKSFWSRMFGSDEDHPETAPTAMPAPKSVDPSSALAVTEPAVIAVPDAAPPTEAEPESAPHAQLGPDSAASKPAPEAEPEAALPPQAPPESSPVVDPVPPPKPEPLPTHKLVAPRSDAPEAEAAPAPAPAQAMPQDDVVPQPVVAPAPDPKPEAKSETVNNLTSAAAPEPASESSAVVQPLPAKPAPKPQRRTLWGDLFGYDKPEQATPPAVATTDAPVTDDGIIPTAGLASPAVLGEPAQLSSSKAAPKPEMAGPQLQVVEAEPKLENHPSEAALPKPEDRSADGREELEPVAVPAMPFVAPTPTDVASSVPIAAPIMVAPAAMAMAMPASAPTAMADPEPPTRYIEVPAADSVPPASPVVAAQPTPAAAAPVVMAPMMVAPVMVEPDQAPAIAMAPIVVAPVESPAAPPVAPAVPTFRVEAPSAPNADGLVTPKLVSVIPVAAPSMMAGGTVSVPSNAASGAPLAQVNFLPASQAVDSVGQAQLQAIAEAMQMAPQSRLLLNAYAKASNEPESRRISLNRALTVRTKLAELGIQPSRINVQALGEDRPSDIDGGRDRVDAMLR